MNTEEQKIEFQKTNKAAAIIFLSGSLIIYSLIVIFNVMAENYLAVLIILTGAGICALVTFLLLRKGF